MRTNHVRRLAALLTLLVASGCGTASSPPTAPSPDLSLQPGLYTLQMAPSGTTSTFQLPGSDATFTTSVVAYCSGQYASIRVRLEEDDGTWVARAIEGDLTLTIEEHEGGFQGMLRGSAPSSDGGARVTAGPGEVQVTGSRVGARQLAGELTGPLMYWLQSIGCGGNNNSWTLTADQ